MPTDVKLSSQDHQATFRPRECLGRVLRHCRAVRERAKRDPLCVLRPLVDKEFFSLCAFVIATETGDAEAATRHAGAFDRLVVRAFPDAEAVWPASTYPDLPRGMIGEVNRVRAHARNAIYGAVKACLERVWPDDNVIDERMLERLRQLAWTREMIPGFDPERYIAERRRSLFGESSPYKEKRFVLHGDYTGRNHHERQRAAAAAAEAALFFADTRARLDEATRRRAEVRLSARARASKRPSGEVKADTGA